MRGLDMRTGELIGDRRYRLPKQGCDLRPPVQGLGQADGDTPEQESDAAFAQFAEMSRADDCLHHIEANPRYVVRTGQ